MKSRRSGFTLVEMLVVVAIIGILGALILPAIGRARASARRTQCIANLRSVAQAATAYAGRNGRLPNSGTYGTFRQDNRRVINVNEPKHSWVVDLLPDLGRQDIHNAWTFNARNNTGSEIENDNTDDPYLTNHVNFSIANNTNPGFPDTGGIKGRDLLGSSVNPDDQDNAALTQRALQIGVCPNDDTSLNMNGGWSYVCNSGYGEYLMDRIPNGSWDLNPPVNHWWRTLRGWGQNSPLANANVAKKMGVFWPGSRKRNAADDTQVTLELISSADGLSSTIMFSENLHAGYLAGGATSGTDNLGHGDFTWAHPFTLATGFVASTYDICPNSMPGDDCYDPQGGSLNYGQANAPGAHGQINRTTNGTNEGISPFPSSYHTGGVVISMCDGSARFLSETVDGAVYAKLITPLGSKLPKFPNNPTNPGLWQSPVSEGDF